MWVIDQQAEEFLDLKEDRTCAEDDMDALMQWWMHSALKWVGACFASAITDGTDYRKIMETVFLLPFADCIDNLEEKKATIMKFQRRT